MRGQEGPAGRQSCVTGGSTRPGRPWTPIFSRRPPRRPPRVGVPHLHVSQARPEAQPAGGLAASGAATGGGAHGPPGCGACGPLGGPALCTARWTVRGDREPSKALPLAEPSAWLPPQAGRGDVFVARAGNRRPGCPAHSRTCPLPSPGDPPGAQPHLFLLHKVARPCGGGPRYRPQLPSRDTCAKCTMPIPRPAVSDPSAVQIRRARPAASGVGVRWAEPRPEVLCGHSEGV